MSDSSGFYLCEEGELCHAPNFVIARDYELRRESRDQYQYPVHGWSWFDSEADARAAFGLPVMPPDPPPPS